MIFMHSIDKTVTRLSTVTNIEPLCCRCTYICWKNPLNNRLFVFIRYVVYLASASALPCSAIRSHTRDGITIVLMLCVEFCLAIFHVSSWFSVLLPFLYSWPSHYTSTDVVLAVTALEELGFHEMSISTWKMTQLTNFAMDQYSWLLDMAIVMLQYKHPYFDMIWC